MDLGPRTVSPEDLFASVGGRSFTLVGVLFAYDGVVVVRTEDRGSVTLDWSPTDDDSSL